MTTADATSLGLWSPNLQNRNDISWAAPYLVTSWQKASLTLSNMEMVVGFFSGSTESQVEAQV